MKEIRIASANTLYRIDTYIADIDIINLEKQAENAIKK